MARRAALPVEVVRDAAGLDTKHVAGSASLATDELLARGEDADGAPKRAEAEA